MDKLLKELLDVTLELCTSGQEWEYERYVSLVELRQVVVDRLPLHKPLTLLQEGYLNHLRQYEEQILHHMQALKDEAEHNLNRINVARKQQQLYTSASEVHADSFMFDKRK
ncbi:hypothetical protein DNH61_00865 [Paenibacillus sambharensis]|uniref:Flagellar protein FliT n=1 Tax=Paenibacillus sambharensis TaxID=1803190 RepID=A0A2W1LGA2_9BACL|nr:hypothetical protein [Paenibacillus sambharensis]PZD97843.1 hypothetical protein DNH61_00865 [Paenibacillus sambharensis]